MVKNILGNGARVNNMVRASIFQQRVKRNMENGRWENA